MIYYIECNASLCPSEDLRGNLQLRRLTKYDGDDFFRSTRNEEKTEFLEQPVICNLLSGRVTAEETQERHRIAVHRIETTGI